MWPAVSTSEKLPPVTENRWIQQHEQVTIRGVYHSVLQALALCSFLDNNRQRVNLQGKKVLELGAGTGLVTIVASLLGEELDLLEHKHKIHYLNHEKSLKRSS